MTHRENVVMVSADAKCKVSRGEPGTPIAAVTRGKRVIVGMNESFQVTYHDFSKISLIPDGTLIQVVPSPDEDDTSGAIKTELGAWHSGQVFYSIKDMALEGSTAWRWAVELSRDYYKEEIPERLYIYMLTGVVINGLLSSKFKKH